MYNHYLYLSYWIVNVLTLLLFNLIFPDAVVLGNSRFVSIEAAIYTGFWLTFTVWVFWDLALIRGWRFDWQWLTLSFFWLINTFAIWLVARVAHIAGFGIISYHWAIIIGLMTMIGQRWIRNKVLFGKN